MQLFLKLPSTLDLNLQISGALPTKIIHTGKQTSKKAYIIRHFKPDHLKHIRNIPGLRIKNKTKKKTLYVQTKQYNLVDAKI